MHMGLPLKPQPLAPKQTRLSIVYCLSGDLRNGGPLVLSEMSKSLDVPYATSFTVQSQHVLMLPGSDPAFSPDADDGLQGDWQQGRDRGDNALEVDNLVGVQWHGRCMVKGIVEAASIAEAKEASKVLCRLIREDLSAAGC
uniref:Uncharacterized protein n=1 Tax=Zooxanthella nutricula TaxID=1333877 RepID=A0A7S2I2Z6_9DINO